MSEPPQKRPRTEEGPESREQRLKRLIDDANGLIGQLAWFVCDHCNKLALGSGEALETSKWGYERIFCSACICHCTACDEDYAPSMQYRHDDCPKVGDDDASSESGDSERSGDQ